MGKIAKGTIEIIFTVVLTLFSFWLWSWIVSYAQHVTSMILRKELVDRSDEYFPGGEILIIIGTLLTVLITIRMIKKTKRYQRLNRPSRSDLTTPRQ